MTSLSLKTGTMFSSIYPHKKMNIDVCQQGAYNPLVVPSIAIINKLFSWMRMQVIRPITCKSCRHNNLDEGSLSLAKLLVVLFLLLGRLSFIRDARMFKDIHQWDKKPFLLDGNLS